MIDEASPKFISFSTRCFKDLGRNRDSFLSFSSALILTKVVVILIDACLAFKGCQILLQSLPTRLLPPIGSQIGSGTSPEALQCGSRFELAQIGAQTASNPPPKRTRVKMGRIWCPDGAKSFPAALQLGARLFMKMNYE